MSEQYLKDTAHKVRIYSGVAPKCRIIMLKVLDENGNGNTKKVLDAVMWVKENRERYHIKILNISVGMLPAQVWRSRGSFYMRSMNCGMQGSWSLPLQEITDQKKIR